MEWNTHYYPETRRESRKRRRVERMRTNLLKTMAVVSTFLASYIILLLWFECKI